MSPLAPLRARIYYYVHGPVAHQLLHQMALANSIAILKIPAIVICLFRGFRKYIGQTAQVWKMPVLDWEKTITCPYNPSHQITLERIQV